MGLTYTTLSLTDPWQNQQHPSLCCLLCCINWQRLGPTMDKEGIMCHKEYYLGNTAQHVNWWQQQKFGQQGMPARKLRFGGDDLMPT